MQDFLQIFGDYTIKDAIIILSALGFLWAVYKKYKKFLDDKYKNEEEKREKEIQRDKDLQEALSAVRKYPEYRQQSIDIQNQLNDKISNIEKAQREQQQKLDDIIANSRKREKNKLYEKLSRSYNLYANELKNPMLAWTDMEATAFWGLFEEYEAVFGDGYMHSIVQPAMKKLRIIKMDQEEEILELMRSRKV